jgi:transposase
MPRPVATSIEIPSHLRPKLKKLATSRTAPFRLVQRAQLIELAAAGWDNGRIAARVGLTVRAVRRWRNRFAADPRLVSLEDQPRPGRPPEVPLAVRARLISLACERVDDDKTPFRVLWNYGSLQTALRADTGVRLSTSEIGRILRNEAIRPHRVRMWLNSQDPQFALRAREVCRHYLEADPAVTVLCIDEKRLFAHQRRPGLKPPARGRHGRTRKEFAYSRHGSSVLLAAFDIRTGQVYAECRARRTGPDLVEFLEAVARRVAGDVVVIWDNLNVHYDGAEQRWTRFNERHSGRFTFVHTPKHASWLNQVECWFSILERRVLRHASFESTDVLNQRVLAFVKHWNQHEAHPFRWTFRGHFAPRTPEERHVGLRPRGHRRRLAA